MKFTDFASAALVSFVALTGAASAAGIVPGSDYYTEAAADRQANTVIRGELAASPTTLNEVQSFGYPAATGTAQNLIPGSRQQAKAEQTNSIGAIARGDYSSGFQGSEVVRGRVVPGSGSF